MLFIVTGGLLTFLLIGNVLAWVVDEFSFEGMLNVVPLVRPVIVAGFEIPPFLALLLLGARWRTPYYRSIYRTWAAALAFGILLSLARALKITAGANGCVLSDSADGDFRLDPAGPAEPCLA